MKHPISRIRMVDGFNEGWIDLEGVDEHRRGTVTLETVIAGSMAPGCAATPAEGFGSALTLFS